MKTSDLESTSIKKIEIVKVQDGAARFFMDDIAVEEPLEIRISFGDAETREVKNISVTMRTPGNDFELAIGFLFTEGIISSYEQVDEVHYLEAECSRTQGNLVIVQLRQGFTPQLMKSDRNFYTTSSCGVCGKGSIQSIRTVSLFKNMEKANIILDTETLYQLSDRLLSLQNNFSTTGGIHASGLFTVQGDLLALREDVGRHNALDKLIGYALSEYHLPLDQNILVLSGRASFELIQKAAMVGISVVAAIGAPSSLAVDLAKEFDMTLMGFLKNNRLNIYNQSSRHELQGIMNNKT